MLAACFFSDVFIFCLSIDVCVRQSYDEQSDAFRTNKNCCVKILTPSLQWAIVIQATSLSHRSRGQRPRFTFENNIRPVRANQFVPSSAAYAAIVTHLERSHHFRDQRATAVANNQHPRAGMGVSIAHPSKSGMQFNYDRRHCGPRSRPVQSH